MSNINIPKLFLQQSATLLKKIDTSKWGDPVYDVANPIKLENIRIDTKMSFQGSGNERRVIPITTLFIYTSSQPAGFMIDKSFLEAKVTDDKQMEYLVKDFTVLNEPNSSKVFGYEVELG